MTTTAYLLAQMYQVEGGDFDRDVVNVIGNAMKKCSEVATTCPSYNGRTLNAEQLLQDIDQSRTRLGSYGYLVKIYESDKAPITRISVKKEHK